MTWQMMPVSSFNWISDIYLEIFVLSWIWSTNRAGGGPKNIEYVCGIQMNAKKISALLGLAKWRDRKEKGKEEGRTKETRKEVMWFGVFGSQGRKGKKFEIQSLTLLFYFIFFPNLGGKERKGNGPWLIFLTFPLFLSSKQGMYFFSPQIKRRRSKLFVTYLVPVIMTFPTKLIFFHLPNES